MADMLLEINGQATAVSAAIGAAVGELLHEHNGRDVSVLDLRGISDWTDFFVIATVTSGAHMDGLERHIKEFCHKKGITIGGVSRKNDTGYDEWRLIDLGFVIIHLMSGTARDFYELEKLWAPIPASRSEMPEQTFHSSKSS
ncbi:MAG: ribosome silencing factor [Treponema sp.]|jgi:ribosome-associated protein|nr:ribosome silencing factor [Treponema sp.]